MLGVVEWEVWTLNCEMQMLVLRITESDVCAANCGMISLCCKL